MRTAWGVYRATFKLSDRVNFPSPVRNRNAASEGDCRFETISPRSVASALSSPSDLRSLISPAPRTSTAAPPVSRSTLRRRRRGISICPSRGLRVSPVTTNRAVCSTGYHCAENLIDRDLLGDLHSCDARRALSYLQIYFGVDRSRVFAEPQELRQRSAHSQRL